MNESAAELIGRATEEKPTHSGYLWRWWALGSCGHLGNEMSPRKQLELNVTLTIITSVWRAQRRGGGLALVEASDGWVMKMPQGAPDQTHQPPNQVWQWQSQNRASCSGSFHIELFPVASGAVCLTSLGIGPTTWAKEEVPCPPRPFANL